MSKTALPDINLSNNMNKHYLCIKISRSGISPYSVLYLNAIACQHFISINSAEQVSQSNFCFRPHQTYCPENQIARRHRFNPKGMFCLKPTSRTGPTPLLLPFCRLLMMIAFTLRIFSTTSLFKTINRLLEPIRRINICITAVSLFETRNNAGVDNLSLSGGATTVFQKRIKFCKLIVNQFSLCRLLPEKPNSFDTRRSLTQTESQKAQERQTIKVMKPNSIIRQIIKRLNNKDFEHQNDVIGFSSGIALSLFFSNLLENRMKLFPVDKLIKLKKWIIVFVHFFKSIIPVKKSNLQNIVSFRFGFRCSSC